jgi:hypothetical protein
LSFKGRRQGKKTSSGAGENVCQSCVGQRTGSGKQKELSLLKIKTQITSKWAKKTLVDPVITRHEVSSPAVKAMQIPTTRGFRFLPTGDDDEEREMESNKYWQECGEIGALTHCWRKVIHGRRVQEFLERLTVESLGHIAMPLPDVHPSNRPAPRCSQQCYQKLPEEEVPMRNG